MYVGSYCALGWAHDADRQWWTTLRSLQQSKKYHNDFSMAQNHSGVVSIVTVPPVGLGQRAILCCTARGNVLWDCITYIDDDTIRRINELGGISAIAISHPHYFSTAVEWARAFNCPVYYSVEDEEWIMRYGSHVQRDIRLGTESVQHSGAQQILWRGSELDLLSGEVKVVKTGGHFPGSSVMLWKEARKLMVADSIFVVPSGLYNIARPPGTVAFTFMWSYPNFVSFSRPGSLQRTPSLMYHIFVFVYKHDVHVELNNAELTNRAQQQDTLTTERRPQDLGGRRRPRI